MSRLANVSRVLVFPLVGIGLIASSCAPAKPKPPQTRVEVVTDIVHGVPIADPYRWLEDGKSPEVHNWTDSQMAYFKSQVDSFPGREKLTKELTDMLNAGGIGELFNIGDLYFSTKRRGGQNQPVLYVRHGLNGTPEVLIDPNTLSADATRAMDWHVPSNDGSLVAYGVSSSGTERTTLYIIRTADKSALPDTIPDTRSSSIAWLPDNSGFYYTRNPEPGSVPAGDDVYFRRVFFHKLGTDWKADPLLWGDKAVKTDWPNVVSSPDGRWLFVTNYHGYFQQQIFFRDERKRNIGLTPLLTDSVFLYDVIPLNDRFFIRTNEGAGRFRVMSATYDHPERENWKEVVPESKGTINSVLAIGNRLIVNRLENAYSHVTLYSFDGTSPQELTLPTLGTAESFAGEWRGHELFFYFSSYTVPPSLLRYDLTSNQLSEMDRMELKFDFTNLETKQVWFNSKDGTPISMFIVEPKGTKLDGSNPVLLNGYGGFGSSDTPIFSRKTALWLLHGGIYVDVNLRGGGEYGDAWHQAGVLEKKQNVFDDFIAAAEYLIKEKYTTTPKLAIYGGSNGGLLIGAVITQRPDLYAAAVCDVPLLDMIRYDRFQLAKLWNTEYGSADDSIQFKYLLKYSPYQNVHSGTKYPAVLFKAGESDSRVDPMHARKMAALMQASTSSDKPIFLRVDSKSGHGQGKPTAKVADEIIDEYCFLFQALGLRL